MRITDFDIFGRLKFTKIEIFTTFISFRAPPPNPNPRKEPTENTSDRDAEHDDDIPDIEERQFPTEWEKIKMANEAVR